MILNLNSDSSNDRINILLIHENKNHILNICDTHILRLEKRRFTIKTKSLFNNF